MNIVRNLFVRIDLFFMHLRGISSSEFGSSSVKFKHKLHCYVVQALV